MKLAQYMYHINTFHLPKTEGVNQMLAVAASKKPPKNAMKLTKS